MGSSSDWETMQGAADTLTALASRMKSVSSPRIAPLTSCSNTPRRHASAASRPSSPVRAERPISRHDRSQDLDPVLGVPVQTKSLSGMDSLLSIAQMPSGVPVATFAIGAAGAKNAALFAAAILANEFIEVRIALDAFRSAQTASVLAKPDPRLP